MVPISTGISAVHVSTHARGPGDEAKEYSVVSSPFDCDIITYSTSGVASP